MFKNYIKIAWRNLLGNKTFSLINILGLAIAIAASSVIFRYVNFELSYDQFHKSKDNAYRVFLNIYKNGALETQSARVSPAVASTFQKEFPAIETFTRMVILGPDGVLTYKDQYTGESDILLADSAFFDVFSYDLLRGNERTALSEPFCVVITEKTATTLFGLENPIGKDIVINAKNFDGASLPFKVTGVIEDFPPNTHLHPGVLISYPTLFEFVGHRFDDSWYWNETYTYFRLHPDADRQSLEAKFPEIVHSFNENLDEQGLNWEYKLQPITDIHLHSDLQHEVSVNGNAFYVYFLAAIGLLIIVIAYINFVNLSTVKALQRAKEIGVRKVSGARRRQLITQILLEALLINGVAIITGFILMQFSVSYFSELFDVNLSFLPDNLPGLLIGLTIFALALVLGSGFYPAFVISRYDPVKVLKGEFSKGKSGTVLRKSLVAGQFAITLGLIAITLVAIRQVNYMQSQSLGFDPEQILVVKSPKAHDYGYGGNFPGFQNKIEGLSMVKNVSGSNVMPGQEIYWYDDQVTIDGEETSGVFSMSAIAPEYFKQFDIPLIAGRHFTDHSYDQENWIINESAVRLLGFGNPEQAVGRRLNNGEIIGVVKDFHHESLKTAIPPILFNCGQVFNYYSVKIGMSQTANTLAEIKAAYAELFPGSPYEYFFLDEFFNRQYKAERQFNTLFGLFSGLAVFIACLGLFGLSSYTAVQRTKEIGIRKVMGATEGNIVALLSKDFFRLLLIASAIALPLAYWIMNQWLENFAFRTEITWRQLAVPVALTLLLILATVSVQTIKTAFRNPAKSIRHE